MLNRRRAVRFAGWASRLALTVASALAVTACGSADARPTAQSVDNSTEPDEPPYVVGSCTPASDTGLEIGDTIVDGGLFDCADTAVPVHGLCGPRATLVIQLYGWCPPCFRHVELARELQAEYADDGLATLVVVSEDPLAEKADAAYCAGIRDHFGFDGWFLTDPRGDIEQYDDEGLVMVLDEQMRIEFLRTNASDEAIRAAVVTALESN